MTPYEIEICLWYYSRGEDWNGMDAPIWPSTLDKFKEFGLLESAHGHRNMLYAPTAKLMAFVDGLCAVPMPIQIWAIPQQERMLIEHNQA
jgi:hypothetical protein